MQKNNKLIIFDLDDTLYLEKDYVYSGFHAVSQYLGKKFNLNAKNIFSFLKNTFEKGKRGNNFNLLLEEMEISEPLETLINVYRTHVPEIKCFPEAKNVLSYFRIRGVPLILLTDGYPLTQNLKIEALKILKYFDEVIINDISKGTCKVNEKIFRNIIKKRKIEPLKVLVVGDNPRKDFDIPIRLGMMTVRIVKRDGLYEKEESDCPPMYRINDLKSLKSIYNLGK